MAPLERDLSPSTLLLFSATLLVAMSPSALLPLPTMLSDERDEFAASSARLQAMQGQEISQCYAKADYLSDDWQRKLADAAVDEPGADAMIRPSPETIAQWRHECSEWSYGTVDLLDADREIVSLAVSYMDRFLGRRSVGQRTLKVTWLAALHLAIKLSVSGADKDPRVLRFLLWRGGDEFAPGDVVAAERDLLAALEWRVTPPTPADFGREFLGLLPAAVPPGAREEVHETAEYLVELSVSDYVLSTRSRPSSVALAALLLAMEQNGVDATELLRRVAAAGVDTGDGKDIVKCRERLLLHFQH